VSHDLIRTPQYLKNSGNTLSLPSDIPVFIFAIAKFISSIEKGAVIAVLFSVSLLSFASLVFISFENCLCGDALVQDSSSM